MKYVSFFLCMWVILWGVVACQSSAETAELDLTQASWEEIEQLARGSQVTFMMWQGSPPLNAHFNQYVIPTLQERYGIELRLTGGQGPQIVQLVMGEKEAGVTDGQVDMVWINGETFFQLRQIDGLWGPFVSQLPHAQYVDFEDPYLNTDFQQPVNGMESPWQMGQFALVYDSGQVVDPPRNLAELEAFVKAHPGTFTVSNDFTGMTLLKSFLVELSGSPDGLNGPFDETKYERLAPQLWAYLNRIKPYFWKEGQTFPKENTQMTQLFATGELLLGYGFGQGGIEEKVREGLFPKTTRAYAWDMGTIKNANYLGIPHQAGNKAGAMVVINFLLSPEVQLRSINPKTMDSNTVLDVDRLPQAWQDSFAAAPKRLYGPNLADLADHAIQEPAPQYMIRLYDEFRSKVIGQ
jgi:putative spermidine/putrescine transport system substrate-binding protein